MEVFITYEKDGYGGQQVAHVWETEDDAIRSKMDELEYLKRHQHKTRKPYTDADLREMAKDYVYVFEVETY